MLHKKLGDKFKDLTGSNLFSTQKINFKILTKKIESKLNCYIQFLVLVRFYSLQLQFHINQFGWTQFRVSIRFCLLGYSYDNLISHALFHHVTTTIKGWTLI